MVLLNYFSHGFFWGLGFFASFLVFVFVMIFMFGGFLKKRKELKLQKKLNLKMLQDYLSRLSSKGKYEEAGKFTEYIECFKTSQPMDEFFKIYKIIEKRKFIESSDDDEDDNNSIFGKIEKTYHIRKRKE